MLAAAQSLAACGNASACLGPPRKDETPELAGGGGFWDQGKTDESIVAESAEQGKSFARLKARFESVGMTLIELSDGSLLATRWNLCRTLPDAAMAARFLRQIGGAA